MELANDLFLLIKSMTKSEKRYFKLNATFHSGEKEYVRLFDLIEKQKKYDEKKIIAQFKNKPPTSHLSIIKNRLYTKLLNSLELYEKNIRTELRSYLTQTEILYNKELFPQAKKILAKAKKLAEEKEQFLTLVEVSYWEMRLIRAYTYKGITEEAILEHYKNENKQLELYKETSLYNELSSLYFFRRHLAGLPRNDKQLEKYKSITENIYLKDISKAKTFIGKVYFYILNASIYFTNQDFYTAYKFAKQAVDFMELHPAHTQEMQITYLHALNNLIIYQFRVNKMREAQTYIKKLKHTPPNNNTHEMLIFFFSTGLEMERCNYEADFKNADEAIKEVEVYLSKHNDQFPNQRGLALYFMIAVNYFMRAKYKKSLYWINRALNDRYIKTRSDIYNFSRILNLLIHFELGNFDLLETQLSSTHKALDKKEVLFDLENYFLSFLKMAIRQDDISASLKKFESDLKILESDKIKRKGLEYFDFISWIKSKKENRSLADIIKEKGAKNR